MSNYSNINPYYIQLIFLTDFIKKQLNKTEGTTVNTYTIINANNTIIPLPPRHEQDLIVEMYNKFNLLLKKIVTEKNALINYTENLKLKLLDTIFNENSTYKSYYQHEVTELQNICTKITKGSTPTTYGFNFLNRGISFIKVENVKNYRIDNKSINCFISNEANEFQKRSQLKENDILFSIAGTIGRTCIVTKENLPANTNQAFAILSEYKKITPKYLLFFLEYSKLLVDSHGAGMLNATLTGIKKINIWYPVEKNIQEEMTNKIESLFKLLDSIIS